MIRLLIPALLAPGAAMAAWTWWRQRRAKTAQPQRTAGDVFRDAANYRTIRQFNQAIDDYDAVWVIVPDASNTARIAHTQHRLDKHRKEDPT